jgi:C1A family cysteine protease
LPTSYDWRTKGIVTPVKNQGGCGSCWAFSSVAIMESAILKAGGPTTNLSEQFLVSCNTKGFSCAGGGYDTHLLALQHIGL